MKTSQWSWLTILLEIAISHPSERVAALAEVLSIATGRSSGPRVAGRDIHELAAHGKDAVLSQSADAGASNLAVTAPTPLGSSSWKYSVPPEPLSRSLLKTEALKFRGRT